MATIRLKFSDPNNSLQKNDTIYYCKSNAVGGFETSDYSQIVRIGKCTSVQKDHILVDVLQEDGTVNNINLPEINDYIFFSKDNKINLSSLKGYFAKVKLTNNSSEKAELFQVTLQTTQSSK